MRSSSEITHYLPKTRCTIRFAAHRYAYEKARDELVSIGLGQRLGHYPGQLSGGEQQRVALARAFVARPSILLADEPTGSLDKSNGDAVIETLFQLQIKHGTTLVLVTHAPELANRCARIVHLADGQVVSFENDKATWVSKND